MDYEKIIAKLSKNDQTFYTDMFLYDESPDDIDRVLIEMTIGDKTYRFMRDDYFSALQGLREELEAEGIQIMCNGAARNVYPSPMQQSMGSGNKAYKLVLGRSAKMADVVDIFECEDNLEYTSVDEQKQFYTEWLNSIMS